MDYKDSHFSWNQCRISRELTNSLTKLSFFLLFEPKQWLFPPNLCSLPREHRFPPPMNIFGKPHEHRFIKHHFITSHLRKMRTGRRTPKEHQRNTQRRPKEDLSIPLLPPCYPLATPSMIRCNDRKKDLCDHGLNGWHGITVHDFANIGFIGSRSLLSWGANYRFMGTWTLCAFFTHFRKPSLSL